MPPVCRSGARHLREATPPAVRYRVLLRVPRVGGRQAWAAASEAFAEALQAMQDTELTGARILTAELESERRRGRDQVAVAVSIAVLAADPGAAFTAAWGMLLEAAAANPGGWDLPAASAEVAPVTPT